MDANFLIEWNDHFWKDLLSLVSTGRSRACTFEAPSKLSKVSAVDADDVEFQVVSLFN